MTYFRNDQTTFLEWTRYMLHVFQTCMSYFACLWAKLVIFGIFKKKFNQYYLRLIRYFRPWIFAQLFLYFKWKVFKTFYALSSILNLILNYIIFIRGVHCLPHTHFPVQKRSLPPFFQVPSKSFPPRSDPPLRLCLFLVTQT